MTSEPRSGALLAVVLLASALASCAAPFRAVAHDAAPAPAERLALDLDPFLLDEELSRGVRVEIDWVAGMRPHAKAVAGLERMLRETRPAGKPVEVVLDDEIPRDTWERLGHDLPALAAAHVSSTPDDPALVYVLYRPGDRGSPYGMTDPFVFERDGKIEVVRGIHVYPETLERTSFLWITDARSERSTLIHEMGHVLGLVTNPAHEHRRLERHCGNPGCVLVRPTAQAILWHALTGPLGLRLPQELCRDCREDIDRARAAWRALRARGPEGVARLRARQEAWRRSEQARFLLHRERLEEAVAAARDAARLEPDWPPALAALAHAEEGAGEVDAAVAAAARAAERGALRVGWTGVEALCRAHRYAEAEELAERLEARQALDAGSVVPAVWARVGTGRFAEAAELLEPFARDSRHLGQGLEIAHLERRAGRFDRAARRLDRLHDVPATRLASARLLLATGRVAETAPLLASVSRDASLSPDLRALAAALAGDAVTAREALEAVRERASEPGSSEWFAMLHEAQVLAALGDRAGALAALDRLPERRYRGASGDPCLIEDLTILRGEPAFDALCAPRYGSERPAQDRADGAPVEADEP